MLQYFQYFAGSITVSEQEAMILILGALTIVALPFYLLALLIGRKYKNRLITDKLTGKGFVYSVPAAYLAAMVAGIFASSSVDGSSTPITFFFTVIFLIALSLGSVSLLVILLRSYVASRLYNRGQIRIIIYLVVLVAITGLLFFVYDIVDAKYQQRMNKNYHSCIENNAEYQKELKEWKNKRTYSRDEYREKYGLPTECEKFERKRWGLLNPLYKLTH